MRVPNYVQQTLPLNRVVRDFSAPLSWVDKDRSLRQKVTMVTSELTCTTDQIYGTVHPVAAW